MLTRAILSGPFMVKLTFAKSMPPSMDFLLRVRDLQDLVAGLPLGLEGDERVAAAAGLDLLQVEFVEGFLAAGGLLGLTSVG